MTMNSYPIFLKPNSFEKIEYDLPPLPEEPPKPREPKLIKKNWFEKLILQCDEFEDQQINQRRIEKYLQKLHQYQEALVVYRQKVQTFLTETNIDIYRRERKRSLLLQTELTKVSERDVLKGRYESMFNSTLKSAFNDKIKDDVEFELPNGLGFVPDFAYIDTTTGLCIDIEIDEPYSLPQKKAIHCIGDDDYRNNYFLQKGWFIIRFAEIQVAQSSNECVQYIENVINHIYTGVPIINNLHLVPQWTHKDSYILGLRDFRDTY